MLKLQISRDTAKALDKMPDKHFCQVYDSIGALLVQPEPEDSGELVTNVVPKRLRKDVGEYRLIYWFDETTLYIDIVGKRNDKDVYKQAKRKGII